MRIVAAEEHFATPEYLDLVSSMLRGEYPNRDKVEERLLRYEVGWLINGAKSITASGDDATIASRLVDVGEGRIKVMDEEGIDVQVLSFASPGVQIFDAATATELAHRANDWLAGKIKAHPDRFVGLATIAPQDPIEAANELDRAVRQLGMRGAVVNSHTKGEYLDDKKFWPILAKAADLRVPIYLHPRCPSSLMFDAFAPYRELAGPMIGFAIETSLHAMRLICSGVFDQYPDLKVILGHLGEAIPFWLDRMDNRIHFSGSTNKLEKLPSQYFRDNFVVTTSGMWWNPAFLLDYQVLGADNILFAVDYPFQGNWEAIPFLQSLAINPRDKERIAHLNAEKLFGIGPRGRQPFESQ